ncbi:MAG: N-acetylneuraminate synthase, partial [Candidatus Electrothrix sp. AR5]|nr:N-acetylneuraminate synthase [Candidatus Electrothrix sp. AR5]
MHDAGRRVFVIAEAGVNHNGSLDRALRLIDAAAEAGADAVKFQTFKTENIVIISAPKADYQQKTTGSDESQFAMLKRLELSYDEHYHLLAHCQKSGIQFLSTAFDFESLDFLVQNLGLKILKIPSGEITNAPLLLAHARTGCDLILSTGMATLSEVEAALGVIAFGLMNEEAERLPSAVAFHQAYFSDEGQRLLRKNVTLLHCTSEYPAPPRDINLNVMRTMSKAFGLRVGYSDHSKGLAVSIAATALGAEVIEKHFTLDKSLKGPDHKASLNPEELKEIIAAIRTVEVAMGDGVKIPALPELNNRSAARKSLVAAKEIRQGQAFTEQNIT